MLRPFRGIHGRTGNPFSANQFPSPGGNAAPRLDVFATVIEYRADTREVGAGHGPVAIAVDGPGGDCAKGRVMWGLLVTRLTFKLPLNGEKHFERALLAALALRTASRRSLPRAGFDHPAGAGEVTANNALGAALFFPAVSSA